MSVSRRRNVNFNIPIEMPNDTIIISNDEEPSCIDLTEDDEIIEINSAPRDSSDSEEAPSTSTITLRNRNVIRHSTPLRGSVIVNTRGTSTPIVTIAQESDEDLPELVLETPPKKKGVKRKVPVPESNVNNDTSISSLLSCPVCFDNLKEVKKTNRQIVSTICGHIFCDACLINCLETQKMCPTCRKKLRRNQFHPVYL